jgi:mRNA interferase MazF
MATPRRGEVWLIDFGMAGKTRPALVVSGAFGDQDRALITVIPHTTSLRGSAFEVAVPVSIARNTNRCAYLKWPGFKGGA